MRLACLVLLALAGYAVALQERTLLQATLPPVCVVSPVPGFLQSVKRVCPPDYPVPIPPLVGGPQTCCKRCRDGYVASSDGKLCIPRKCPDAPAGEVPWVAVQTTVDGVLICVKCKEPTFIFDPATKLCLEPCKEPLIPFNPPPKCCEPCPPGFTQVPQKPACLGRDGTVQDMECVDRKTSQSFTTVKVEPYKRDCAPAICPPAPVLTIPGSPVKCVQCKPPFVAYLNASGNPQCRKACPTGYLPCGPYCFSASIPAVTGILNSSTPPAACAAFLALFGNCIPKCP